MFKRLLLLALAAAALGVNLYGEDQEVDAEVSTAAVVTAEDPVKDPAEVVAAKAAIAGAEDKEEAE